MPVRRTRGTTSTEATRQREHTTARHRHNGAEANGRNGSRSLFERARRGITEADLPDLMGVIQHRASRILRDGEAEVRKIAGQLSLMSEMLKSRWDDHRDLPWRTVAAFTVAIMYFIGPFDVVPDKLPVIGFLDDAAILAFCFRLIQHDLKHYAETEGMDLKAYGLS
jgi:uncharacterized membrane protein YkvA (DUF1232 family)